MTNEDIIKFLENKDKTIDDFRKEVQRLRKVVIDLQERNTEALTRLEEVLKYVKMQANFSRTAELAFVPIRKEAEDCIENKGRTTDQ